MVLSAFLLSSSFVIPQDVPTLIPVEKIASLEPGTEGSKCIWADSILLMLLRGPMTTMIQSSGGRGC
ncbi:hypothetical protein AAC387_Pa12g0327 [Persea americana]